MRLPTATRSSKRYLSRAAIFASLAMGSAVLAADAEGATEADDTYTWTAHFVAHDESAETLTLEARVEAHAMIENLASFEEGDRLTLVWTGRQWAAGIRDIARDPDVVPEALTLPIEFVASEDDGRYVQFRVPVPDEAAAIVGELDPGTAVTGTSPRMESDWASGVLALRDYNDVS